MAYTDAFGMKVTYGRGEAVDANGVVDVTQFGAIHQVTQLIDFDKDGMPSAADLTIRSSKVPAGSAILSASLVVLKAAADATVTVDVGTVELDGTAIDEDGLVDGATLAAGVKAGAGLQISTVMAKDGYIKVTPSSTDAADLKGLKALLIVEYV